MCVFGPIIDHVQEHGVKSDRIIVFCRTYNDCSAIFQLLELELTNRNALILTDEPGTRKFVCEKFTVCSSQKTKSDILSSFTKPDGVVRIVVATIAFSMGLDTPNVRQVIHWGPPEDLELCLLYAVMYVLSRVSVMNVIHVHKSIVQTYTPLKLHHPYYHLMQAKSFSPS